MSLKDLQRFFTRLYLDGAFRQAFVSGHKSAFEDLRFSMAEVEELKKFASTNEVEVAAFCEDLQGKRGKRISAFYPLVFDYLSEEKWSGLIRAYCRRHPFPESPFARDAYGFGQFATATWGKAAAPIEKELLLLEMSKAYVFSSGQASRRQQPIADFGPQSRPRMQPSATLVRLHCDPRELKKWVVEKPKYDLPRNAPALPYLLYVQLNRDRGIATVRIGELLAQLLELSDGNATAGEIDAAIKARHEVQLAAPIWELLLPHLLTEGIVAWE